MSIILKQSFLFHKTYCFCINYSLCIIHARSICLFHILKEENKLDPLSKIIPQVKPSNKNEGYTWVGPPHPVSNLRLKIFPSSKDLTKEEIHFYERSKETQEWNQQYWESHNSDFVKSEKSYIKKISKERNFDSNRNMTIEEMADFYKEFLNKNYKKHATYNWQWYKRNFELLYLSAKAQVSKIRRIVKKDVH